MKSIKYLLLGLVVGMMATSCEKNTVDFPWESTPSNKVSYKVYNFALVQHKAANYIKYLNVNGTEYCYDHATILQTYNYAPSGTGAFYTADPGALTISMDTETSAVVDGETKYERANVYNQATEELKAGGKYQIFIYDYTKAPKVFDFSMPIHDEFLDSAFLDSEAGIRLYNFLWDAPGVPTTAKVQWRTKSKKGGEYEECSEAIGFGERTEWLNVHVKRADLLDYCQETLYYDLVSVDENGEVIEVLIEDDYWTTRAGRNYEYVLRGDRNYEIQKMWVTQTVSL